MNAFAIGLVLAVVGAGTVMAQRPAQHPSDDQVRHAIIEESVAEYKATGHPCACPYDRARNGSACGRRSAYSRPGGAAPLCYSKDVSAGMVLDWRRQHGG